MHTARGASTETESLNVKTIPEEISFIANGKAQVYNTNTSEGVLTIVVAPYRE